MYQHCHSGIDFGCTYMKWRGVVNRMPSPSDDQTLTYIRISCPHDSAGANNGCGCNAKNRRLSDWSLMRLRRAVRYSRGVRRRRRRCRLGPGAGSGADRPPSVPLRVPAEVSGRALRNLQPAPLPDRERSAGSGRSLVRTRWPRKGLREGPLAAEGAGLLCPADVSVRTGVWP